MHSSFRIDKYLNKSDEIKKWSLSGSIAGPYDLAIVIPALAETEHLFLTLESIAKNPPSQLDSTLIICVINNKSPLIASREIIENNQESLRLLKKLIGVFDYDYIGQQNESLVKINKSKLDITFIDASSPDFELSPKSGVGQARKIGLDHGLKCIQNDGLLVCLDADSLVEENYLAEIRRFFRNNSFGGASIEFEHQVPEDKHQHSAILSYEIFLRYYVLGLYYAGSPYAYHTIGSTMVFRADAYAAVDGMVRREAGEDFYFLQKIAKYGGIGLIKGTTVHPSSRSSWRVPFGTGKKISELMQCGTGEIPLYHPEIFNILKAFLNLMDKAIDASFSVDKILEACNKISLSLCAYLKERNFEQTWPRLVQNNPDKKRLLRQFNHWFDAFSTLKLIHYLRDSGYGTIDMETAALRLFDMMSVSYHKAKVEPPGRVQLTEILDTLRLHFQSIV